MMKLIVRRKQPGRGRAVPLPEDGFDYPFQESDDYTGRYRRKEDPRTIVELRMCTLSNRIREEPNWWEKIKDKATVKRWKEEALRQEAPSKKITPAMVNYVLDELRGYASLRDPETGVEVGPAERIWKSDKLIPRALRAKLLAAVIPLETVPDSEKDWHPGSEGLVLNLVHPSLYPIVFGRTMGRVPGSDTITVLQPPEIEGVDRRFVSKEFQWLPSDFFVDGDGRVTLTSPYINNVHPTLHKELHSVIPEILQLALPMFERVLSNLLRPLLPMRIATSGGHRSRDEDFVDCIWEYDPPYQSWSYGHREEYEASPDAWRAKYNPRIPDAKKRYSGDLKVMGNQVSLKGRILQVIVKLVNVLLTPDEPEYPGGNWHVEGARNEMIVSSFIYYYDSENISESGLSFRRATSEPQSHGVDDPTCTRALYDMDSRYPACVQETGDVITKTHRCVAFPNLYQHKIKPFGLEDPTKPGHRKILVFFLVDPTQKILSATDVAPQQREWVTEAMQTAGQNSAIGKLPVELLSMVMDENEGAMSRSEAEEWRVGLIHERATMEWENVDDRAYFGEPRPRDYYICGFARRQMAYADAERSTASSSEGSSSESES